jgi:hypothetical protein
MTPRQQKAAAIARALRRDFGDDVASVISALPLDAGQQLRIQVVDSKRDAVVGWLCERAWLPSYLQIHHRVSAARYELIPATIYEVRIEEERPIIPDVRKIPVDAAEKTKNDAEFEAMKKAMGR